MLILSVIKSPEDLRSIWTLETKSRARQASVVASSMVDVIMARVMSRLEVRSLAEHSSGLITHSPHASREKFLAEVDELITELEQVHARVAGQTVTPPH